MIHFERPVSHRHRRAQILRELRSGQLDPAEALSADNRLIAAANFHGWPARTPCPACGSEKLRLVRFVVGENLGLRAGTARGERELAALVAELGEVATHVVEVCPRCRWNILVRSEVAVGGPGARTGSPQSGLSTYPLEE